MAMLVSDVVNAYNKRVKESTDTQNKISYWESLLAAPAAQYQSSVEQATATRDYDISGAYANWKQNQLKLMQSSRLGTGVKSELSNSLQSAYQSQYNQAQQQWANSVSTALQNYTKNVNAAEEQVNTLATQFKDVQSKMLEYANEYLGGEYDTGDEGLDKMFRTLKEGGYGFFEKTDNSNEYGSTSRLYEFIEKVLNNESRMTDEGYQYNFAEWLERQGGFDEFLNMYKEDPSRVADILGGSRASDLEYTKEERATDYLKNEKGYDVTDGEKATKMADLMKTDITSVYKEGGWLQNRGFDSESLKTLANTLNSKNKDGAQLNLTKKTKTTGHGRSFRLANDGVDVSISNVKNKELIDYLKNSGASVNNNTYTVHIKEADAAGLEKLLDNIYYYDLK